MIDNFMSKIFRYIDIPAVALFIVAAASFSAVASITTAANAGASAYGAYPFQPYPGDALSVRNDRCYSSLNEFNKTAKLFGISNMNFGLVNAIVNLPIYDWDQSGHGNPMYDVYQLSGSTVPIGSQGLRGSLEGRSVGYAERFNFSVSPIPNMTWVARYLSKQVQYDVNMITGGGGGPRGTAGDPLIANPFIYTQGAIVTPGGMPRFQAFSGPLYDNAPIHGGLPNIWDIPDLLPGAVDTRKDDLGNERDLNREILNNRAGIEDSIRGVDREVDNFIGMLASTPILQNLVAQGYDVDAWDTGKRTLCYEDAGSNNIVPAYAFSVPRAGIPITIPGWIFSVATLIDGKGFSASGMTLYTGGSLNGKDMLDCFGRGIQPTVYGHNRTRIHPSGFALGLVPYWDDIGLAMSVLNGVIWGLMTANGAGEATRFIPAIITAYEDYTTGFAFLFDIHDSVVENPAARRTLPEHLNKRAIDFSKSKLADINLHYAFGGEGRGHESSQNAQQLNPDVYMRLYSPFVLNAGFEWPSNPRQAPDGTQMVDIKVKATKHGFKDEATASGGYREDVSHSGGPTYDPNKPAGSDRSFTEAKVYKMVVEPGVVINSIDATKIKSGVEGVEEYYRADTNVAVNAATDPCEFFANQLRVGDDVGAKPSSLTPDGSSNANNALPDAPVIDNRPLGEEGTSFTCGEIASEKIEMASSVREDGIHTFTEKIPAETPPGTKICFAVRYSDYTNDLKTIGKHWWNPAANHPNWNPNHNTPEDKTFLTRANCIISGYKPSFQVRGGDLLVDGKVDTGLNTKEFLGSTSDPKELRTYGSWAEYGVIAKDRVAGIGSGALYRTGMIDSWNDIGYLTFGNAVLPDGSRDYGKYGDLDDGFARVARQFTAMKNTATTIAGDGAEVNVAELDGGVYELVGNKTIVSEDPDGNPANVRSGESIILLARDGDAHTIASDIRINNEYQSISEISQVVIAPADTGANFRINIAEAVTNVDAWLITPDGSINTCYTGRPSGDIANTPRALTPCEQNRLQVNGPVAVERLILRRSGGKDQSSDPNVIHQSVPAETFNLRPDAYIWASQYVSDGGRKYITTHSMDLPPRY